MKLHNLLENYDESDEVYLWCVANIKDFSKLKWEEKLRVYTDSKSIHGSFITIETRDEFIPYGIYAERELRLYAPKLKLFSNLSFSGCTVFFNGPISLDFDNLEDVVTSSDMRLKFYFKACHSMKTKQFLPYNFDSLAFDECRSDELYDFSTYTGNLRIGRLIVRAHGLTNIKNLTSLLDEKVNIREIFIMTDNTVGPSLSRICNKYLAKDDKENYTMDLTLELLDEGFSERII